jgi:hypothetical protein
LDFGNSNGQSSNEVYANDHWLEGLTKPFGGLKVRVSAGAQQMRKKSPPNVSAIACALQILLPHNIADIPKYRNTQPDMLAKKTGHQNKFGN